MLLGVDFSHYQSDIAPALLQAAGVTFIWHKCGEYRTPDSEFQRRRKLYSDFLFGAYYYEEGYDGALQADLFLQMVAPLDGKTPLALDLEAYADLDQAEHFINRIHDRTGLYPILYSRLEYIINEIRGTHSETLGKCLLWIADQDKVATPRIPLPWTSWYLWQHGTLNIGNTTVDKDYFSGTLDDLKRIWSMTSPTTDTLKQVRLLSPVKVVAYKAPHLAAEVAGYYNVGDMIQIFPGSIEDTQNKGVFFFGSPENWYVMATDVQYTDNTNPPPDPTPQPVKRWVSAGNVVNLRQAPNTSAAIMGKATAGQEVDIYLPPDGSQYQWCKTSSVNGVPFVAYIASIYLTATAPK